MLFTNLDQVLYGKVVSGKSRRNIGQNLKGRMQIDIIMLDDNPVLVEFTREISRINGGRAVICIPGDLGKLVFKEEIKRRKGRI